MDTKPVSKSIYLITHTYFPVMCGGAVFSEKMAEELSGLDYRVSILTTGIGRKFHRRTQSGDHEVIRFFTGRKSNANYSIVGLMFYYLLGLPQMLWFCWRNKPDLIFPIFVLPSGLIGIVIAKLLNIPCVVFVDSGDTPGIESNMPHLVNALTFLFKFVTRHADGVGVLEGIDDVALPLIKNKQIMVIPNGTSLPDKKANPGKQKTVQFLSIGRMVKRKGFHYIIDAADILARQGLDFRVSIIGYGQEMENLHKKIKDLNLSSKVSLLGRVEYDQLESHYLRTDCYIFYGKREGSSLSMIEAVAYGLPVIATLDPGNDAFVTPDFNGALVPESNPQLLATEMKRLIDSRDLIEQWADNSLKISEKFDWTMVAEQYASLFLKVFKDKKIE